MRKIWQEIANMQKEIADLKIEVYKLRMENKSPFLKGIARAGENKLKKTLTPD